MNLNTENIVRNNVVAVVCGSTIATAFFIDERHLLTARHNIVEHLSNSDPVFVILDDMLVPCSHVIPLGNNGERIDVALIELSNKVNNTLRGGLKLLSAKFKREFKLHTIGYPKEVGDCSYPIHLPLRCEHEIPVADADIILVKTSDVSFFSYEGYSGAPVYNENGSVLGILIIQENQNLRAISISKLETYLQRHNIEYSSNAHFEDDSPTGLLMCKQILEKAFHKAGGKYSPSVHISNKSLDAEISSFINPTAQIEFGTIFNLTEAWCVANDSIGNVQYGSEDSDTPLKYLESIRLIDDKVKRKFSREEWKLYEDSQTYYANYIEAKRKSNLDSKKLFAIFGPAGVGKSHLSCHIADTLLKEGHNVYYFFGNEFSSLNDVQSQMLQKLDFEDGQLKDITLECGNRGKEVIFIIDAINEGPSFRYWEQQITKLLSFLNDYDGAKLLITGRRSESQVYTFLEWNHNIDASKVRTFVLDGFDNVEEAIDKYCLHYGIDAGWTQALNIDFSNPLMLSLFCKSRQGKIRDENISRLEIYSDYLTQRNISISEFVNADPARNITLQAVKNIAKYSVFYNHCNYISRDKAAKICNRIVNRQRWSDNLLNALISESILYEILENEEYKNQGVDFEFQNIGDVLKADALIKSKRSFNDILRELSKDYQVNEVYSEDSKNCLIATIALWDRYNLTIEDISKVPIDILIDTLWYGGSNKEIIEEVVKQNYS